MATNDSNKTLSISITAGAVIKIIALVAIFSLLYRVRDVVLVVLTSVVVASSIEPLIKWFERRRIARIIGVLIAYSGLAFFFSAIFYFFVPSLLDDTANFLGTLPKYLNAFSSAVSSSPSATGSLAQTFTETLSGTDQSVGLTTLFSIKDLLTNFSRTLVSVSGGFIDGISLIFGGALSLVLIVVLSFYFAVQEDGIENFLKAIVPPEHEKYAIDLWKRAQNKIGRWMQGQLLLAVIVGILVYLSLTIFGIKHALFLAVLAALLETIPLFGPVLAAIPAIGVGYADGGVSVALLVLGIYLIIQQFENHLVYPLVVKKIVGVPPILVILALVVGAKLAGFLGIVLSVPIAATLMEYFTDREKRKQAQS